MKTVQHQFRACAGSLCWRPRRLQPKAATADASVPKPVIEATEMDAVIQGSLDGESFAQVESLVLPNSGCGLKPGGSTWREEDEASDSIKRPSPLTIRLSEKQKKTIKAKAHSAGISVNRFVLASALGSDYCPPANPELTRALLCIYRELNAQGNNLNQIAWQLNAGVVVPAQEGMLDALAHSLQKTLRHVRDALASGGPGRGP